MDSLIAPPRFKTVRIVKAPAPRHVRTAWVSDLHLGTRTSDAAAFLEFLRNHEIATLYIVGDLIDVWQLRRGIYWPQQHNDVIQKILRLARKGTQVIYIPGNHDEFVERFCGHYGNITIETRAIHTTADGRRILIMHGHELDAVVQHVRWLAYAGDVGYQFLLSLNPAINLARRLLGREYWSLSAYAKKQVKDAVNFIGEFEQAIVRYAQRHDVDAVLCGHIHSPAVREIGGVMYYNCGDWVETRSAIVEDADGRMELSFFPTANILRRSDTALGRTAACLLVSVRFEHLWIYLTAPFIGASLAVVLCRCLRDDECCPLRFQRPPISPPLGES